MFRVWEENVSLIWRKHDSNDVYYCHKSSAAQSRSSKHELKYTARRITPPEGVNLHPTIITEPQKTNEMVDFFEPTEFISFPTAS
jgi:hypothetical protein